MDIEQMEAKIKELEEKNDELTTKNQNKTVAAAFGLTKEAKWKVGGKLILASEFEETEQFEAIVDEFKNNYKSAMAVIKDENGKLDNKALKEVYKQMGVCQEAFWYAYNYNSIKYNEAVIEDLEKKIKALDNSDLETEAVTLGVDVEEELERQEELKGDE